MVRRAPAESRTGALLAIVGKGPAMAKACRVPPGIARRMESVARLLFLLLLLLGQPALAAGFDARLVRVLDGDSLIVERLPQKRESELRLEGIDAPERGQPWGPQARSALRRLVTGQPLRVEVITRDRYGRLVVQLWAGRTDVNLAMVASGNAWAYRAYNPPRAILKAEAEAKAARRGLWSLPPEERIPPATWRERHPRSD